MLHFAILIISMLIFGSYVLACGESSGEAHSPAVSDPTDIGKAKAPFKLPGLPYAQDALAPIISDETLQYHHGKHHQGYIDKLNTLLEGHELAEKNLETIVRTSTEDIANNAGQVWNHSFFWRCLKPEGKSELVGPLKQAINDQFGSFEDFKTSFVEASMNRFGSGWAWLVWDGQQLAITTTGNAGNPLRQGQVPILTMDLWEHAYYIDYRNQRRTFVSTVLDKVIDWEFANANYGAATANR